MPVALTKNERFSYILEAERLCADRRAGACPAADKCKGTEADCAIAKMALDEPQSHPGFVRPDPAKQTVFILRSWGWAERAAVLKMIQTGRPQIEFVELGLRFGLIGWENFKDATGRLVEFPEGKNLLDQKAAAIISDSVKLDYLDGRTFAVELFNEIWKISYLEEAERKN